MTEGSVVGTTVAGQASPWAARCALVFRRQAEPSSGSTHDAGGTGNG